MRMHTKTTRELESVVREKLKKERDFYKKQMLELLGIAEKLKAREDNKFYERIAFERGKRLAKSKEAGDYEFCVAHGLTEALRIIDKAFPYDD